MIVSKINNLFVICAFTFLFGLSLSIDSAAAQKSIEGHWEGTMVREGAKLPVSFDFTKGDAERLKASFNSPTQRATGIPLQKINFVFSKIHFELVGDATTIIFDGDLMGDTISGQFRENDAKGTFSLRRGEIQPATFKQEEVSFREQ